MFTIYDMDKKTADETYKRCDACEGRILCPEATCIWPAVVANGGLGKVYCTAPEDKEKRITRFGM